MKLKALTLALVVSLLVLATAVAQAEGKFNYIAPADVKAKMAAGAPLHLMDIQVEEEFAAHHLKGAYKTTAYPVKSAEEKAKLDGFVALAKKDAAPVVIICPRGAGGAERAYDYLKAQGIAESRLLILEKGQAGWPYPELLEKK